MSVYVGIDVHRKRSQVAVIGAGGEVLANRNVPNGAEPILKVIGGLPPGTPAALEAAFGTGWLMELLEDYGFRPAPGLPVAVQGDRLGQAEERQGRRCDLGPAATGGPAAGGVDRVATGAPAAGAAAQPDQCHRRRARSSPARGLLERPGPGLARIPGAARRLAGAGR